MRGDARGGHRLSDHVCGVGGIRGQEHRVSLLGDLAELPEVKLGDPDPCGVGAAGIDQLLADDREGFSRGSRSEHGGFRLRLSLQHSLLLLTLRAVHRSLALSLGLQHRRPLATFRFGLHLHGHLDARGRDDVADLVTKALEAPVGGGFVDRVDDAVVEVVPLLERLVEGDLANLAAHRGLRELRDGVDRVLHAVRRLDRVHHA